MDDGRTDDGRTTDGRRTDGRTDGRRDACSVSLLAGGFLGASQASLGLGTLNIGFFIGK